MTKQKSFYIIASVITAILICLTIFMIIAISPSKNKTIEAANDVYTLTVNKTSTVSAYISGESINKVETTNKVDKYEVKKGTQVAFRAVNESKIFTSWDVNPSISKLVDVTSSYVVFTPTSDLEINILRRDPLKSDYGKYIQHSYRIDKAEDLVSLKKMFDAGNNATNITDEIVTYYNSLFAEDEEYENYSGNIKQGIANKFFNKLQSGYFNVTTSFAVMEDEFTGIGNETYPFKGVMCGLNGSDYSNIFINTTCTQTTGNNYCGLFGILEEESVVRNLRVNNSPTIKVTDKNATNLYLGGLAGIIKGAYLYNVKSSIKASADKNKLSNIYLGGLAGETCGSTQKKYFGIDSYNQVECKLNESTWLVKNQNTTSSGLEIMAGGVAGRAYNTYIKQIKINVTNFSIEAQSVSNQSYISNNNIYIGNLFGYYENDIETEIKNIEIYGTEAENLSASISSGNAYVSGMIGYISAQSQVGLGSIKFKINNGDSQIQVQSIDKSSRTNLYSGGLIAKMSDDSINKVVALDDFKNGIKDVIVDGVTKYTYDAIYDANINIKSIQRGITDKNNYGKSVAGGLVGYGYINMNGTSDNNRSDIIITSKDYNLYVNATQAITATNTQNGSTINSYTTIVNDKEHCVSGLVYGLFSTIEKQISIENVDFYASKFMVSSTREMGSMTASDLHVGGLAGYAFGINISNVSMLLDNGSLKMEGYSSEEIWSSLALGSNASKVVDANNAFTGGVFGEYSGTKNGSSTTNKYKMSNVMLSGYDYNKQEIDGNTVEIFSICNTASPRKDYSGENYVGGIIGRLYRADIEDVTYLGSNNADSLIDMQCNKNPDTSFCGGIVGYIKNNDSDTVITSNVKNCLVDGANIKGFSTCTATDIGTPDMYVGGIIGASFNGGASSSLDISNCRVYNSNITSTGNERQLGYAAGIIGINTWYGTTTISDCYVSNCVITSNYYAVETYTGVQKTARSCFAAGILGEAITTTTYINNCGVFDTTITSENHGVSGDDSISAGICTVITKTCNIHGCYSNATLKSEIEKPASSENTATRYGIAPSNSGSTVRSYFIEELANSSNSISTSQRYNFYPLNLSNRKINTGKTVIFENIRDEDKGSNKYYPILLDGNFDIDYTDKPITISKKYDNVTDLVRAWINVKADGDTKTPRDYATDKERADAGWFLFARVVLEAGERNLELNEDVSVEKITYPIYKSEYQCINEEIGNQVFKNLNYPYDELDYIGYTQKTIDVGTILFGGDEKTLLASFQVYFNDNLPNLNFNYRVKNGAKDTYNYYPSFFDASGNLISSFNTPTAGYARYTIEKKNASDNENDAIYELKFTWNSDLKENRTFYLGFNLGAKETPIYSKYVVKLELIANKLELVGFKYADYTKPINYNVTTDLGLEQNPWLLKPNAGMKIIPLFTKSNDMLVDGKKKVYDAESNVEQVNYSLTAETINKEPSAVVNSSGILKCNSNKTTTDNGNYVTLTLKEDKTQTINIYFKIVSIYNVSYSSIGASTYGLLDVNTANDYRLDISIYNGFCGVPLSFNVEIKNTLYDMDYIITRGWIKDQNNNVINSWDTEINEYVLIIPNEEINDDIVINIEFNVAYVIKFDAQSSLFNPNSDIPEIKNYKVIQGTKFTEFFNEKIKSDLDAWIESKKVFGYVCMGFYLIDSANSIVSYGVSLDELLKDENLVITTSYTFYARWSFLIEIIEAPGTKVKTSFSQDFLDKYGVDENGNELSKEELDKLQIRRAVTIPINSNQGYIFTIEKEEGFIGRANVQAYICTLSGLNKELQEIDIEKYHDNMYMYKIPAELITGYLIIVTSTSNSELIVGENTSQVMDTILPEDGVYTFKYVANHFNKADVVSYIYNSGTTNPRYNLELNRDVLLKFYKETYDPNEKQTKLESKSLVKGTIIEVYYQQYINGECNHTKDIVGTYMVDQDNLTNVLLSDFKKLNYNEPAFDDITFDELLRGTDNLSEVYYFVITPPNGYKATSDDDSMPIVNNYIYVGYYDENKSPTDDDPFVKGARANRDLDNIPLEGEVGEFVTYETSCHIRSFSVVPSRNTVLEKGDGDNQYSFKDIDYFKMFDLKINDVTILPEGIISLQGKNNLLSNTIESNLISDGILNLSLSIGYNLGFVSVYAKTINGDWELVEELDISSYEYKNYEISFGYDKQYKYFKIENQSEGEIRINGMSISSSVSGITFNYDQESIKQAMQLVIDGTNILRIVQHVAGDTRHDGKKFVMAVQFKNSQGIIETIPNVKIKIGDNEYSPYYEDTSSNNQLATVYFDLTSILQSLSVDEINITIVCPSDYNISCVELLEAISIQKPASAEVRYVFISNN